MTGGTSHDRVRQPLGGIQTSTRDGLHPDDRTHVLAHNRVTDSPDRQLITTAWPQPWAGDITRARVLILAANPGWSADDAEWDPKLAPLLKENLAGDRPMFWLDRAAAGSPGETWIRQRLLASVLKDLPEEVVAAAVCVVDFHAYHSPKWLALPVTLPTQWYSFRMIRERLQDGATVIITRAEREWKIAIPELIDHPRVFTTRSKQNTRLSPRNLGQEGWEAVTYPLYAVHRIWFGG